ncbi:hypothetical protein PQR52_10250 [Paraburkholderia aspalathi]|uniref:hypothetical protein n=1 Tax=Paraburkholderia aspalathi TaxID=1324617 RepID=UPI0038B98FA7
MSKKMNLHKPAPYPATGDANERLYDDPAERIKQWLRAGPGADTVEDAIRNGVKTGQTTVSMQIRLLKSQADLLKTAAFVENRPAAAILRQLLGEYFQKKCDDPNEEKRDRWLQTLLATHYDEL